MDRDAAAQTSRVSLEIVGVSGASRETGRSVGEVLSTSPVLETEMQSLEREMPGFLQRIRSS